MWANAFSKERGKNKKTNILTITHSNGEYNIPHSLLALIPKVMDLAC